jgi:hypothetical protein
VGRSPVSLLAAVLPRNLFFMRDLISPAVLSAAFPCPCRVLHCPMAGLHENLFDFFLFFFMKSQDLNSEDPGSFIFFPMLVSFGSLTNITKSLLVWASQSCPGK